MKWIALTGGMGCGKSALADMLSRHGYPVWEADAAVHRLLAEDPALCEAIRDRFGDGVLSTGGRVSRRLLAERVTGDASAVADLNAITHPRVRQAFDLWRAGLAPTHGVAVAVVPLLFEAGWTTGWNWIVCVHCDRETQFQRLRARGMAPEAIAFWTQLQWPAERKCAASDLVIENTGGLPELERQAANLLERIRSIP